MAHVEELRQIHADINAVFFFYKIFCWHLSTCPPYSEI
jgi:hypothetical protein